jgi:hypothetical protein
MNFTRIITIGAVLFFVGCVTVAASTYSLWSSQREWSYWNQAAHNPTTTSQDPLDQGVDQIVHGMDRQSAKVAAKKVETANEFGLVGIALFLVGLTMMITGAYLEPKDNKSLKQQGG